MTVALEGGEWSAAHPGCTLPPGKIQYPFYWMLGGPQGRSGQAENLVPSGIRSRTVQPVVQSLYQLNYLAHTYLTIGNILKFCTWSLKIYYQLPLIHCAPFNVFLSMAWITGFSLRSKPICQEYIGHFHPPAPITLLNGSVSKCRTPVLKKALHLPKILLNT